MEILQNYSAWHFHAPHDWESDPMQTSTACILFCADLWVWSMYYSEREVAVHAHKKYTAHRNTAVVAVHFVAGVTETVLGLLYLLNYGEWCARVSALVAIGFHIPTGFYLSPKVWGLRHITVPGYLLVNICRLLQAVRTWHNPAKSLPDLWILLHMATLVRICSYYITPYSSTNGQRRGDLVTDPLVYTLSVSLAALVTLSFVYPPVFLLTLLGALVVTHHFIPSAVTSRFPPLKVVKGAEANTPKRSSSRRRSRK